MNDNSRGWLLILAVCILLAVAGWAFRGDALQLIGGDLAAASYSDYPGPYPGPYPLQFLPAVLVMPTPSPVPLPLATLHVGLNLRWDGAGVVYFDGYTWRPGTHLTREIDQKVDSDTVRIAGHLWYSPNPLGFDDDSWYCHYNTVTNRAELCSGESDPAWKWGEPWIMPADVQLANGRRVTIDGQVFDVSGPHTFLTGNGQQAYFWRFENRDRFLYHYGGGEWKQYVEVGDVILFYELGSGINLYQNIKRTYYKNDNSTSNYVQYESLISQRAGLREAVKSHGPEPEELASARNASPEEMVQLLERGGLEPTELLPGGLGR